MEVRRGLAAGILASVLLHQSAYIWGDVMEYIYWSRILRRGLYLYCAGPSPVIRLWTSVFIVHIEMLNRRHKRGASPAIEVLDLCFDDPKSEPVVRQ